MSSPLARTMRAARSMFKPAAAGAPLEDLQRRLNYRFEDVALLERALVHRSYGAQNNERMEYLGDGVLNFIIAEQLYRRFEQIPEGALTRLRAELVRGETLAEIARTLELGACMRLGQGEYRNGGSERPGILADTLEAVLGAVYLDRGFEASHGVVCGLYARRLASLDPNADTANPKSRLQEYLQKSDGRLPCYSVEHTSGPPHRRIFQVRCRLPGEQRSFTGEGNSRRRAEEQAAVQACRWWEEREHGAVS